MPILVYLFDVSPEQATTYSLFIVGITAMIGSYRHYKLEFKTAIGYSFTLPSLLSLLLVRTFLMPLIPDSLFTIFKIDITKAY
jgi:uncharacterized membrane protein YfcA